MRVTVVQHDIEWEDAEATHARLEAQVSAAAGTGADLIVLTEMFATGFSMRPERIAQPEGGASEKWLIEQATRHGSWLIGSVAQFAPDSGRPRNVALVVDPSGAVKRYAKIHPFSYTGEHEHYDAGTDFLTVDIGGLRVSVFICYDLRFADEFWAIAQNTDCYVVVANWPEARRLHWRTLLSARAIENQAYVVGANRVGAAGRTDPVNHVGDSTIIDPLGEVLASAAGGESLVIADITAEHVAQVRARFPFLADRR